MLWVRKTFKTSIRIIANEILMGIMHRFSKFVWFSFEVMTCWNKRIQRSIWSSSLYCVIKIQNRFLFYLRIEVASFELMCSIEDLLRTHKFGKTKCIRIKAKHILGNADISLIWLTTSTVKTVIALIIALMIRSERFV